MWNMINIGIADDHPVVRAGLREFLNGFVDLNVVGEAADGREAIDLDVLLLDLMMPGHSGQDALRQIKCQEPAVAVLVLSGYPDELYAKTLIRQGASGYLNKDCMPEQLIEAVRTVARGRRYISPTLVDSSAEPLVKANPLRSFDQLSARELQVFLKLARGKNMRTISQEMSLSAKTASMYRTKVMRKMGFSTNGELTYFAITDGMID
jgi:two-component system invasion response regulator UvrY